MLIGDPILGYRIVFMNWTPEQAIDELRHGGFGYHASTYPNIVKTLRAMDVTAVKQAVFEPPADSTAPRAARRSEVR